MAPNSSKRGHLPESISGGVLIAKIVPGRHFPGDAGDLHDIAPIRFKFAVPCQLTVDVVTRSLRCTLSFVLAVRLHSTSTSLLLISVSQLAFFHTRFGQLRRGCTGNREL